jgi:hypothetical protein
MIARSRPSLSKKDEEYFNQISVPEKNITFKTSSLNHSKPEPELIEKREPVRFKNGVVYTGDWKDNARHGYGVQIWPDGAKYEGYWENGKATGKGKFVHVDGDIYEGDWKEDKACGYGIYKHNNGARYDGDWFDDYQHGYGI